MFKNLYQNKILRALTLVEILEILVYPVVLIIKYPSIPPQIPLFYSRPRGTDQLADSRILFIIPAACILMLIIHIFLTSRFLKTEKLASYLITIISVTSNTLILITILRIIFLVS